MHSCPLSLSHSPIQGQLYISGATCVLQLLSSVHISTGAQHHTEVCSSIRATRVTLLLQMLKTPQILQWNKSQSTSLKVRFISVSERNRKIQTWVSWLHKWQHVVSFPCVAPATAWHFEYQFISQCPLDVLQWTHKKQLSVEIQEELFT